MSGDSLRRLQRSNKTFSHLLDLPSPQIGNRRKILDRLCSAPGDVLQSLPRA